MSARKLASTRPSRLTPSFVIGAIIVLGAILTCLVSIVWVPTSPTSMDPGLRFAPPSFEHPFGCDQFGRDLLARTIVASQPALAVGVLSVTAGAIVGTALGAVAGMASKQLRAPVMRLVDALMAFPGILLAMVLVLILGRGLTSVLVAVAVFMVPTFVRLTCKLTLSYRGSLAMKAAASYGCTGVAAFMRHVLPNIAGRLLTQLTASAGTAMLLEAALSFLGLGVQPPMASWGYMLSESMPYLSAHPGLAVPSGCALVVCVLGFNLLGDGLGDLLRRRSA